MTVSPKCDLSYKRKRKLVLIVLVSANAIWRHYLCLVSLCSLCNFLLVATDSCSQGHPGSCSASLIYFCKIVLNRGVSSQVCDLKITSQLLKHLGSPSNVILCSISNHIITEAASRCERASPDTERAAGKQTETQSCAPSDPLCCVLWMSYVSLSPVTNAAGNRMIRLAS